MSTTYDSWIQKIPTTQRRRFHLIGSTQVFVEVGRYNAGGSLPALVGISICGRFRTQSRVCDVVFMS